MWEWLRSPRGARRSATRRRLDARLGRRRSAFTLIEVMVATAITLILMGLMAQMFAWIGTSVSDSRGVMEMLDRLRAVKHLLQEDLRGVTCPTTPPLDPRSGYGYFEWIEGPIGPVLPPETILARQVGTTTFQTEDTTIGDMDDVIMFTSRLPDRPFFGRLGGQPTTRPDAEVVWFIRGQRLYRRVLLIEPQRGSTSGNNNYSPVNYNNDLSMRGEGGISYERRLTPVDWHGFGGGDITYSVANSYSDLTNRKNRYAHHPLVWPHDSRQWQRPDGRPGPVMPLQYESVSSVWPLPIPQRNGAAPAAGAPGTLKVGAGNLALALGGDGLEVYIMPQGVAAENTGAGRWDGSQYPNGNYLFDPWGGGYSVTNAAATPYRLTNQIDTDAGLIGLATSRMGSYVGDRTQPEEDAVMSHVLEFDVKGWDPGAPLFQVNEPSTPSAAAPRSVVLAPGDPGWVMPNNRGALNRFLATSYNPAGDGAVRLAGFGAYVDLNYMCRGGLDPSSTNETAVGGKRPYEACLRRYERTTFSPALEGRLFPRAWFAGPGHPKSGLVGALPTINPYPPAGLLACVWDTWSTGYESDGRNQEVIAVGGAPAARAAFAPFEMNPNTGLLIGLVDEGTNGLDDNNNGAIDDDGEQETSPPYPRPLRGIQIRIRCFEPDSRQIRSVTLVHEFLPE